MIRVPRDIIDPWKHQESIFDGTNQNILTEISEIREVADATSSVSLVNALVYAFAVLGMILMCILCRIHRTAFWVLVGYLRALASGIAGRTRLIVSIEVEHDGVTQSVVRLTEQVLSQGLETTVEHLDREAIMRTSTSQSMHPTHSISVPLDANARGNTADLDNEQDLDSISFNSCHSDLL